MEAESLILHISFSFDGQWYAYLKCDETTTYNIYTGIGATQYAALQNLVEKMRHEFTSR